MFKQFELNILRNFHYSKRDWTYAKIITAFGWLYFVCDSLTSPHLGSLPEGICSFFDCAQFNSPPFSYILILISVLLAALYVFDKFMLAITLLLAFLGAAIFSSDQFQHNSRYGLLTATFLAQFIAIARYRFAGEDFKLKTTRHDVAMFYSLQIIAAAYIISGISKLHIAGFNWVSMAPNFGVRVIKSYSGKSLAYDSPFLWQMGRTIAKCISAYPFFIKICFACAQILELLAIVAIYSRKNARRYAWLLVFFHLMIFLLLGIIIWTFIVLVLAYLLNLRPKTETLNNDISAPQPLSLATRLLSYLWAAKPAIIFIGLSLCIGEVHPFSRLPMFSSIEPRADFYYLSNENNTALSPQKNFDFTTARLYTMIQSQARKNLVHTFDNEGMKEIGKQFLQQLIAVNANNGRLKQYHELKLFHHEIVIKGDSIVETDALLASEPLKP